MFEDEDGSMKMNTIGCKKGEGNAKSFRYICKRYVEYNLVTYKTETWEGAEATCKNYGMHLVTIPSEEENEKVARFLQGFGEEPYTDFIWTGLNDRALDEKWEWSSGAPVTYKNWARDGEETKEDADCAGFQLG